MADSLREVKRRISSVNGTLQITKAMYMVSSSKVNKAIKTYSGYQDFMARIETLVEQLLSKTDEDFTHPLLEKRQCLKTGYLIVTSDRGLAGDYNSSVYKVLKAQVKNQDPSSFVCSAIGRQGFGYLLRNNYPLIYNEPTLIRDDVMFVDILPLAKKIIDAYIAKEIDRLVIIYNHHVNRLTHQVVVKELLPLANLKNSPLAIDYVFESGIEATLNVLLPIYIQDILYGIILDSKVSEHSARMNSMRNATDNAQEIIAKLNLMYNQARQQAITNELIDIIGGANAVGGEN